MTQTLIYGQKDDWTRAHLQMYMPHDHNSDIEIKDVLKVNTSYFVLILFKMLLLKSSTDVNTVVVVTWARIHRTN